MYAQGVELQADDAVGPLAGSHWVGGAITKNISVRDKRIPEGRATSHEKALQKPRHTTVQTGFISELKGSKGIRNRKYIERKTLLGEARPNRHERRSAERHASRDMKCVARGVTWRVKRQSRRDYKGEPRWDVTRARRRLRGKSFARTSQDRAIRKRRCEDTKSESTRNAGRVK